MMHVKFAQSDSCEAKKGEKGGVPVTTTYSIERHTDPNAVSI